MEIQWAPHTGGSAIKESGYKAEAPVDGYTEGRRLLLMEISGLIAIRLSGDIAGCRVTAIWEYRGLVRAPVDGESSHTDGEEGR